MLHSRKGQGTRSLPRPTPLSLSLVTGFPGFIGRRLVARLVADDPEARAVALVEERMLEPAREAADAIDAERIEVLAGDIGESGLGLSDSDRERLRSEVRRVYHLAAIYDLAVPLTVAQRVNVDGTGNVLELCAEAESLERLAYVSTAYVAGMRTGIVYEHELVMGQEFKNHYESTKFQAEAWVREYMDRVPTTILRPAIVVGDSRTGETQKFDGPYFILRTIAEAERSGRSVFQFGRADAPFNVVPVDFVVEAIAAAAADPAAAGETLHLVDPEPLTASELTSALSREYAGREPRGRIPPRLVRATLRIPAVRERFGGAPPESIVYLNHPVRFDTRRAVALLSPHGLRPPNFPDYVGAMVAFFREHEDDPALRPGYKA
jgi:thioester reductase-like protein